MWREIPLAGWGWGLDTGEGGSSQVMTLRTPRLSYQLGSQGVLALCSRVPGSLLGGTKRQSVELRGLWDKFRSLIQEVAERGE